MAEGIRDDQKQSEAIRRWAVERSCGRELWKGAVEGSCGRELWKGAMEGSCGMELVGGDGKGRGRAEEWGCGRFDCRTEVLEQCARAPLRSCAVRRTAVSATCRRRQARCAVAGVGVGTFKLLWTRERGRVRAWLWAREKEEGKIR